MRLRIGEVTVPSRVPLVIDMGLLGRWSHDRAPEVPEGALLERMRAAANAAIKLRITGADAAAAGSDLGRQ